MNRLFLASHATSSTASSLNIRRDRGLLLYVKKCSVSTLDEPLPPSPTSNNLQRMNLSHQWEHTCGLDTVYTVYTAQEKLQHSCTFSFLTSTCMLNGFTVSAHRTYRYEAKHSRLQKNSWVPSGTLSAFK